MRRLLYVAVALLAVGCTENDPAGPVPAPQRDHTSSTYPSDPGIGAMAPTLLTSWAGVDRSPTWSPDGSRIAFASNRFTGVPTSVASSIYTMDASGDASNLRRITTGTVDGQPTWSPNGATIAFVRNGGIFRVGATGGLVSAIIPQGQGASDPRYSPDGSRIAFVKNSQVWVIPAFGGTAVQVTPSDGALNISPEWLDANTVLYTHIAGSDESVWKMTVGDATSAVQLTPVEPGMFRFPDMKSDASVLVFTSGSLVFQDMTTGLHTIGRMSVTPTTDAAAANVEFSPNGQKVLFVGQGTAPGSYDIYVADVPALRAGDVTPPVVNATVSGTLGLNGWYVSDVTVDFDVADPESGISAQTGCDDTVINSDGANITLTCVATNGAGLQTTKVVTVNRDATAPVITFAGSLAYTVDQEVDITCSATDATSGIASTSCPDVAAGPAWTFDASNTATATASDNAGNSASSTVTFTVNATSQSLSALVSQFVDQQGVANSMNAKLRAAANARTASAKAGQIKAFVAEVNAQVGQLLTQEQADVLIHWANTL